MWVRALPTTAPAAGSLLVRHPLASTSSGEVVPCLKSCGWTGCGSLHSPPGLHRGALCGGIRGDILRALFILILLRRVALPFEGRGQGLGLSRNAGLLRRQQSTRNQVTDRQ